MIISHARRFVFFNDPLDAGHEIERALAPFGDEPVGRKDEMSKHCPFFHGMTPVEAEWAFDGAGYAFHSYLRVSVTENPFRRLSRLFDRIDQTDVVWQLRRLAGIAPLSFADWLQNTRPDGTGAGHRNSPRWRRHGSWSGKSWESGRIDHTIRIEAAEVDLLPVLSQLGVAPCNIPNCLDLTPGDAVMMRYDQKSIELVKRRYAWELAQFGYSAPRHRKAA